jgi:hypothetical protein
MAKKKSVKRNVVRKEISHIPHAAVPTHVHRSGLSMNKSDGIMAIMAAVLVVLTAILDLKISAILAVVLMVLFGIYKLFKR